MADIKVVQDAILEEISSARKTVKTDDYSMSIGELINLYKDGEIALDPAFQRLFRWEDQQKTKLIESILIGIPIPEVFVAQKADGTWHVVDGVQRLSTIYQLVGELKNVEKLKLTSCKYIPSLDDCVWDDLPISTQREFKKSKLKINIILTENSDEAQYELFQRLNTGGTELSEQEVRNCLMLMIKPPFYEKINELKNYQNFIDCINSLKDHQLEKEYHMELVLRMFIGVEGLTDFQDYEPISKTLISEFIDKETVKLMNDACPDKFEIVFKRVFDKLKSALNESSFKKFDEEKDEFNGAFNVSVFEMITVAVGRNIDNVAEMSDGEFIQKLKALYMEEDVKTALSRGVKPIKRFKDLTAFSNGYLS